MQTEEGADGATAAEATGILERQHEVRDVMAPIRRTRRSRVVSG